jgi:hypothetical protein
MYPTAHSSCFIHVCFTLGRPKVTAVYATARGFGPRKGTGCTSDCVGRGEERRGDICVYVATVLSGSVTVAVGPPTVFIHWYDGCKRSLSSL